MITLRVLLARASVELAEAETPSLPRLVSERERTRRAARRNKHLFSGCAKGLFPLN